MSRLAATAWRIASKVRKGSAAVADGPGARRVAGARRERVARGHDGNQAVVLQLQRLQAVVWHSLGESVPLGAAADDGEHNFAVVDLL
jgi:hypothetical protein